MPEFSAAPEFSARRELVQHIKRDLLAKWARQVSRRPSQRPPLKVVVLADDDDTSCPPSPTTLTCSLPSGTVSITECWLDDEQTPVRRLSDLIPGRATYQELPLTISTSPQRQQHDCNLCGRPTFDSAVSGISSLSSYDQRPLATGSFQSVVSRFWTVRLFAHQQGGGCTDHFYSSPIFTFLGEPWRLILVEDPQDCEWFNLSLSSCRTSRQLALSASDATCYCKLSLTTPTYSAQADGQLYFLSGDDVHESKLLLNIRKADLVPEQDAFSAISGLGSLARTAQVSLKLCCN